MSKILLELKDVSKRYKRNEILKDINIKIEKNKIFGLLGPNGAGKSTILKVITGILHPTNGVVLYEGKVIGDEDFRNIGALIEHPALYKNLSAYENLKVHALSLGVIDERIDMVLKTVGLENSPKKVGHFSLGMKQRLGIGIAILHKPKLLILDEPTNGLDPFGIRELRLLIKTLVKEDMTIIVSSHILNEIENIADNVGIINQGEIKLVDSMKNIKDLEEKFIEVLEKGE